MLNTKTLRILIIVTLLCATPVIVFNLKNAGSAIRGKNALFLPDLLKNPDQISKVTLQDNKKTLTLQKHNDTWQIVERNNYPVLKEKVDELLYSLADLRIVEPKTSNQDLYKQLDLNDIKDKDSQALLIEVDDIYNATIAKVYVGKHEGVSLGDDYKEHIFIRKANEDQTWLVQGVIPISNDFHDWVEQPLIGIVESDQIKSLEIDKPQAAKVLITKAKPEQEDFTLENMQAKNGMTLDLDAVNTVPFEVVELEFKDVQLANNKHDWDNSLTATVETFPGVKVVLNFLKEGDKVLARVRADAASDAKPELQQKVLSFNQSKAPWVYELSPEIYKELALSNDDFMKPKELE